MRQIFVAVWKVAAGDENEDAAGDENVLLVRQGTVGRARCGASKSRLCKQGPDRVRQRRVLKKMSARMAENQLTMRTISQAEPLQILRMVSIERCVWTVPMKGRQRRIRTAWKNMTRVVMLRGGGKRGGVSVGRLRRRKALRGPD